MRSKGYVEVLAYVLRFFGLLAVLSSVAFFAGALVSLTMGSSNVAVHTEEELYLMNFTWVVGMLLASVTLAIWFPIYWRAGTLCLLGQSLKENMDTVIRQLGVLRNLFLAAFVVDCANALNFMLFYEVWYVSGFEDIDFLIDSASFIFPNTSGVTTLLAAGILQVVKCLVERTRYLESELDSVV